MADQFAYRKLPSDPCLTEEQMIAYLDGELSVTGQHTCEKHMADCEMCEDAMEGLSLVKDRTRISAPIKTITPATSESGKVVPLNKPAPKLRLYYGAAAVLIVILCSVFFIKNMTSPDAGLQLAEYSAADSVSSLDPLVAEKMDCLRSAPGDATVLKDSEQELAKNEPLSRDEEMPVTLSEDLNEGSAMGAPMVPQDVPEVAEMEEERLDKYFADDRSKEVVADEKNQQSLNTKAEEKKDQDEVVQTETDKKANLFERAKDVVEQGAGAKRAEAQKSKVAQDLSNTDAAPKSTATTPNAPAGGVATGTAEVSGADDSPGQATTVLTDSVTTFSGKINLEDSYQSGLNLLNAGQPNAAINMFDEVLLDKNHPRYEDAQFQKANALIKANRKEEAKTLLESIQAKKGKHAAEATELLKTL